LEHKNVQFLDGKIRGLNINHFTIWAVIGAEDGSSFLGSNEGYSLVINEVYLSGPDGEWVEFYNPTDYEISLKGWKLAFDLDLVVNKNGANQKYIFQDTDTVPSKGFFVAKSTKNWINNSGDTIQLINQHGRIINQIGYKDLAKSATSDLKEIGVEIGSYQTDMSIARVKDGVSYLVKRTGSEVTMGKSNNLSQDKTLLVSIGDGNYGTENNRENSANLPKPVDNKPINFGFPHNLLTNKWEKTEFDYKTSETTKTLVNNISPLVTLDSNVGIKQYHFRIIKDGETEDGKDETAGNGFAVGGYVFSMIKNNPESGIKSLDFSEIEDDKDPTDLDISNLESGIYWLILGAEDNNGQKSAPTKNQDPRIRIVVNNNDPEDKGFIKLKSFDCKNASAIDQNTFEIDGKIYSKNDILELWENPSLLSDCSDSFWKDNIYLKYQLDEVFDENKPSFNHGYLRGVSDDQTKYSVSGVYKLEDKNDQNRVVLSCFDSQNSDLINNSEYVTIPKKDAEIKCLYISKPSLGGNSISGKFYEDKDGNGKMDGDDDYYNYQWEDIFYYQQLPATLYDQNWQRIAVNHTPNLSPYQPMPNENDFYQPTDTQSNGHYKFENLPDGLYNVCTDFNKDYLYPIKPGVNFTEDLDLPDGVSVVVTNQAFEYFYNGKKNPQDSYTYCYQIDLGGNSVSDLDFAFREIFVNYEDSSSSSLESSFGSSSSDLSSSFDNSSQINSSSQYSNSSQWFSSGSSESDYTSSWFSSYSSQNSSEYFEQSSSSSFYSSEESSSSENYSSSYSSSQQSSEQSSSESQSASNKTSSSQQSSVVQSSNGNSTSNQNQNSSQIQTSTASQNQFQAVQNPATQNPSETSFFGTQTSNSSSSDVSSSSDQNSSNSEKNSSFSSSNKGENSRLNSNNSEQGEVLGVAEKTDKNNTNWFSWWWLLLVLGLILGGYFVYKNMFSTR
jgi:hypothetical protein